jgi:alkaline phosphatase D
MTQIINSGTTSTDTSKDYTVNIDATGLQPNTYYYYDFSALNKKSIVGRTKTAPSGDFDSLRFAFFSCANFEAGFFNAYAAAKKRNDFDAVIHLGDYIYEYETGGYDPNSNTPDRIWEPANEIISLTDYRTRFSLYHLDPDLLKLHQQYPFITIWDDHESANNAYKDGAGNHSPATEGTWTDRKSVSAQAYSEWLPIRSPNPTNKLQIWRKLNYGNLADIHFLDTRIWGRDIQDGASNNDTNRTILGLDQLYWLLNNLSSTQAQWNIIAQQVMVAPLKVFGQAVNDDQWDGYPAERKKLFDYILNNNVKDVVVLTGDIHTAWANDLPSTGYNSSTGANSAGVEFVGTSVTSPGAPFGVPQSIITSSNPHIKYVDLVQHGFAILDINKTRAQCDYYYIPSIDYATDTTTFGTGKQTVYGSRHLSNASGPSTGRPSLNADFAPEVVLSTPHELSISEKAIIMGIYPNPFSEFIIAHYYLDKPTQVNFKIMDITGKMVATQNAGNIPQGLYKTTINLPSLPAGMYILLLEADDFTAKQKIIKK